MSQLRVLAGAEARVGRQEGDQSVLKPRPLRGRRRAGEGLEAHVHLQGICRHRHRSLSQLAQAVAQRDRDSGLADAGRPEQGDDLGGHGPQYRELMAVQIGTGLSTLPDPRDAGADAATQAAAALDGTAPELMLAFVTGSHLAAPEATLEGVHEAASPAV